MILYGNIYRNDILSHGPPLCPYTRLRRAHPHRGRNSSVSASLQPQHLERPQILPTPSSVQETGCSRTPRPWHPMVSSPHSIGSLFSPLIKHVMSLSSHIKARLGDTKPRMHQICAFGKSSDQFRPAVWMCCQTNGFPQLGLQSKNRAASPWQRQNTFSLSTACVH